MRKVLVTGASGFVGRAVAERLREEGVETLAAVRCQVANPLPGITYVDAGDLSSKQGLGICLTGVDTVVHAAARVHAAADAAADFYLVNARGTEKLAKLTLAAGVRGFIFISAIKVNGEATAPDLPFQADDPPAPSDAYALSKLEAEQILRRLAASSDLEVVVIRPPLVYGPGVQANFLAMMQWVYRGLPLPLGGIDNRRSLLALDSLVDLISCCITHPGAANRTFLASDGEDLSTVELLTRLGQALHRPARLHALPRNLLQVLATLCGRRDQVRRLVDSLQVDIEKTRTELGWTPVVTVDEGLTRTAQYFLGQLR